ncbi:uncharacterized protein TNCV_3028661 [Trichonephila clavipes]|nr:uncharacterized protein TNCV_3028661 [Trichonephila clavipes]
MPSLLGDLDIGFQTDRMVGTSAHAPQRPVVTYTRMGTCSNDVDCYHAGKCTELEDGLKVCECRNGTSGALCQTVDECVADPDKCGNGTDVKCVFDIIQEEAICKCDNASKQFDYYTETCMVPCKTFSNCTPNGYCFKNEKSKLSKYSFCRCKPGARGDFCEIIDQCQSKEVDCGSDPGVVCTLGKNGQAYCKCKDTKQGFDYDNKICKNCNCGEGFVSCKFENGTKFCDCNWRYKQRFSECAVCDCGYNSYNCSFNAAGEKKCNCKPYYIESKSGQCIDECDRKSCQNGGTCDKVCHCPKGTSGDYCQNVDWCEDFRCGDHYETMCVYNQETTMGECKCRHKNSVYDDNAKNCLGKVILLYFGFILTPH